MLTESEIATMRAQQTAALPTVCMILRRTDTIDSGGGTVATWTPIAPVPGRLSSGLQPSARRIVGDKVAETATHTLTMPADADVRSGDRIAVGDRVFGVLMVISVESWQTALRLAVQEVR